MLKRRSLEQAYNAIKKREWSKWARTAALFGLAIWLGLSTGGPTVSNTAGKVAAAELDNTNPALTDQSEGRKRTVAIVIDDFGNGSNGTVEMMRLPIKITAAIMPFMPMTKKDAEEAHRLGHDVIVHMPMEPNRGPKSWLGPGAILTSLSDAEIRKRVEDAIDNVPHAVGMNNHMGSKATADERVMRIVLGVCKERGLFFLDSRTTFFTVVPKIADELDVPLVSNDVFLDDIHSVQHISKQINVLRKHLESNESCITIGHVGLPGKLTASVLEQSISVMQPTIRFVKLSELVRVSSGDPFELTNS